MSTKVNLLLRCILSAGFAVAVSNNIQAQGRTETSLDFGWQFQTDGDSLWRTVDLPHDFQIEQPWVEPGGFQGTNLAARGFKSMGKAWYRYDLSLPDSLAGRRLLLDFGGIMYVGDVYLDGQLIGGTDYGYVGFEIDVTDKLEPGGNNVITVMADTRNPENSRWYTGGGLFRSVKLVSTPRDYYFGRYPLRITTRDNRYVDITAEMTFRGRSRQADIELDIYDPDGNLVYNGRTTARRITASQTLEFRIPEIEIPSPALWDIDSPNLYTVEAKLIREDGTLADMVTDRFGIRTIEFGPEYGMKLNGKKVLLKGYANHHTLGALGAAAYPAAIRKQLLLMKEFGVNHIRTSHNPYSRELIGLCDQYGILVVDELYDKWTTMNTGGRVPFETLWQKDIPEWIKRDRNSPSVVMWSLGNELQQDPNMQFNDFGVTLYRLEKTLIERYDTTRPVTVAMHPRYRNWETDSLPADLAMITDVQSYNYRYMYFPGDYRRFPWMKFYQSEATVAAMGPNFFEMNLDQVIGSAYWGLIDYLGESQGWPAKGWIQGAFDISLQPKPKAYLLRSMFKPDEPVVHIAVIESRGDRMWNDVQTGNDGMSDHWNRAPGQKLEIITYTNADSVELSVNGKSQGFRVNNLNNPKERNQIRWRDIGYEEGYCEAVAYKDGKAVARHRIETSGPAVKLIAEPDNSNWKADGMDLQHLRVYAVDKKGRRAYTAQDELTFEILEPSARKSGSAGEARIIAVDNGNINSGESYVTDHRSLYNGSALVILRAGHKPGNITLRISSGKLPSTDIRLMLQ